MFITTPLGRQCDLDTLLVYHCKYCWHCILIKFFPHIFDSISRLGKDEWEFETNFVRRIQEGQLKDQGAQKMKVGSTTFTRQKEKNLLGNGIKKIVNTLRLFKMQFNTK